MVDLFPNYASSADLGTSSYDQYVSDFVDIVQPKVLSYNHYFFNSSHFSNLATIRHYALQEDIPFWYIYSACPTTTLPDPTEGQLRWQMYTALAYGAKGVRAYTYSTYDSAGDALIDPAGNPTPKYYMVQQIYGEITTLAPILNELTSYGVYSNGGDGSYVTNVSGGNVVYGRFTDPSGKIYMMFTNKDYVAGHTLSISLNYSSSSLSNGLGRVDKDTGRLAVVDTNGSFSQWFDAGNGELYKILFDTTAASTPGNLVGDGATTSTINIDWDSAYDPESGIDYYCIYRDGLEIGTSTTSYFADTDLLSDTSYSYSVSAVNGEIVESALSSPISLSTLLAILGDANGDGSVDVSDLGILATNYGAGSGFGWDDGDFTGDGIVDVNDLGVMASHYGETAEAVVPEPSVFAALLGLCLAGLLGSARSKR